MKALRPFEIQAIWIYQWIDRSPKTVHVARSYVVSQPMTYLRSWAGTTACGLAYDLTSGFAAVNWSWDEGSKVPKREFAICFDCMYQLT